MRFEQVRPHGVNMYGESEDGTYVAPVVVDGGDVAPTVQIEVPVEEGKQVDEVTVSVEYAEKACLHAESLIADLEAGIAPAVDVENGTIVNETVIAEENTIPGQDSFKELDKERQTDVGTIMESEL